MLKLINLFVLDKIFEEHLPLPASVKMIYINCLMKHFKDLEATEKNAMGFSISKSTFDYKAFENHFDCLRTSGLVSIHEDEIMFKNAWGQLIDRSQLGRETKEQRFSFNADDLAEQLYSNERIKELCQMKYKMNPEEVNVKMILFVKTQQIAEERYLNAGKFSSHFIYWLASQTRDFNNSQNTTQQKKSKLLGK